MRPLLPLTLVVLFLALPARAPADDLDAETLKALEATGEVLKDPAKRKKAAKATPEATKADEFLNSVAGSEENAQAIYDLAAGIMGSLGKDAGGDPDKIEAILKKAQTDPEGFANQLSPADKAKLKDLATKIEATKAKAGKTVP